jgi:hypothetical protein
LYVTLQRGDELPTVALAQARLLERGIALAVDGYFGNSTEKGVVEFQQTVGIPETARVDQTTWAALNHEHPIHVIDAIDATDVTVLLEDAPYLTDGHSQVIASYGMSRGASMLIEQLVASNPPRSIALLRLHGHGGPGRMVVTGGKLGLGDASFAAGHFVNPKAVADFTRLGTIMKPYGSIELHGCKVAQRVNGNRLLESFARVCRVPVSAAMISQRGGQAAARFEGRVLTRFPAERDLRAWSRRVFTECQW